MNRNLDLLDFVTVLSFVIGLYALDIAIENLKENEYQTDDLKNLLQYMEEHLQSQDTHLKEQDKILNNLTK